MRLSCTAWVLVFDKTETGEYAFSRTHNDFDDHDGVLHSLSIALVQGREKTWMDTLMLSLGLGGNGNGN